MVFTGSTWRACCIMIQQAKSLIFQWFASCCIICVFLKQQDGFYAPAGAYPHQ